VARSTTSGAHGGRAVIKVAAGAAARDLTSGFNDNPRWVQRTTGGVTYTAAAWLKPVAARQEIVLRLREWTAAGALVTDRTATLRATSTAWQRIAVPLSVARGGTGLSVAVYAKDLDAGEWFLADDLSLTG
jgi:hypothetical protein